MFDEYSKRFLLALAYNCLEEIVACILEAGRLDIVRNWRVEGLALGIVNGIVSGIAFLGALAIRELWKLGDRI